MTNLQHKLADLADRASAGVHRSKNPLAFSICTEGPHLELWVHYTTSQEGRDYKMNLLKTCHASIPEGVAEFLVAVDNVMKWATLELLKDIAKQLALVDKAARGQLVT